MLVTAPVLPAFIPTFKQDSLQIIGNSKVYVLHGIFCCRSMSRPHGPCLGSEMHAPPYTDILLRTDPRCIGNLRRLVEIENQS